MLLVFGTVFCLTRNKTENKPVETEPPTSETGKDVTVDEPEDSSEIEESKQIEEIEDDGNALIPDESIEDTASKTPGQDAETNDTPKEEAAAPAKEPDNNAEAGIQIGVNPPVEEVYYCGCANHQCQNEDFHASLLNRELEGCPYCGSHSCKSFYALNEWGYTCYDETLCPQYNVQKDSAKVCPDCGRTMWSADNPTGCFRYLQETQCECGELVPGNTCHHH
ncbi:MAG: hypothetical protein PHV32_17510 [Eubacteriales bacterium]|nr:hypothetical protein [Eubacteriales bacterium]